MRQGDDAAFDCIFLRYYERVYRVAHGLVGRREEAEDLSQETFLEMYRHPPEIRDGSTLLTWLCRVALNRGYNALRGERRERQRLEQLDGPTEPADPLAVLLRAEENARVRDALAQLPERQHRLLALRYAGLSYGEVAAVLEVAPGSIGTMLVRAERAFMEAYKSAEMVEQQGALERTKP
jgi:RNA polymerase sigma-70 factor (ECF subfamily)